MARSVLAILAGIVVLTVTSFAIEWVTDPVLAGVLPEAHSNGATWHDVVRKLIMFVYSTLCMACAGYVTAWLARGSKVWHAVIMGAIQTALTALAMIEFRDKTPLWFWIAGIAFTVPAAWCGAILREKWARRPAKCL
jgi:hypothetical protein